MTLVFMFPGQSSRDLEMIDKIVAAWPPASKIIDDASGILSRDLRKTYTVGNKNQFNCNQDIQVGVFLANYLYQQALADHGITGDLSLGLSLGEYNHLLHIGAIDFEGALKLVDARGGVYDYGSEGMMASVFPMSLDELAGYLQQVVHLGVVQVANINSPSQNVIAGDRAAVQAAIDLIDGEDMGVQVRIIEHRIPMHTSLFKPVASELRPHLENANWQPARLPYIPNILAEFQHFPERENIISSLEKHVFSPVFWRDSIDLVCDRYPDAYFIEVGPCAVLFNMLQKSWHRVPKFKTDSSGDLMTHLPAMVTELSNAA